MQFKYPEILWGLVLLIIPIIIHLFQLRRFKKTPFTNVKFLKQVISESRKSSSLKKWILLFTRLLLLTALVLGFAQPFFANKTALLEKETVFYLDDSFSMGYEANGNATFKNIIQEFIQNIPPKQRFSLFTNTKSFKDVEIKDIQNELLNLNLSSNQFNFEQILLKAETFFTNGEEIQKNLIILSDFQKRLGEINNLSTSGTRLHFIQAPQNEFNNVSIDSVYLGKSTNDNIEIVAQLSTKNLMESIPVSLFDGEQLVAKTSAKFKESLTTQVSFSLNVNNAVKGRLIINDNGLKYDNQFYFNINKNPKIKVLSIGDKPNGFLTRIYTSDEFEYQNTKLGQLNYGSLENQNLVILNEIESIPSALNTALNTFIKNGGSLILIPSLKGDISSYNQLTSNYNNTRFISLKKQQMPIAKINVAHPIFKNVFEQKVGNFQFPIVQEFYEVRTNFSASLSFQNNNPFLLGTSQVHVFTASLKGTNSNFKNSPLIVPTFYNIAKQSLKTAPLYGILGNETTIEVPINLQQDDIIKIGNENEEFIPNQRILPKKVTINFIENPKEDGIYQIKYNETVLRNISFNYNRKESDLVYLNIPSENLNSSLLGFFEEYQKDNTINEFWKWFAILALMFVLIETLLQKFLK